MELLLLLLLLLLVPFCGGDKYPDFCHGKPCPHYDPDMVQRYEGFEERTYNATEWITTEIKSTSPLDVMAANSRLKSAAETLYSWPVLVSVKDNEYKLSWFIPPGTTNPDIADPSVTLEHRPEVTVYVRVFGGTPSVEAAKENAKKLCEDLDKSRIIPCAEPLVYDAAGYDTYFSLNHHNEIWMEKPQ